MTAMLLETTIVAMPLVYLIGAFILVFMRRVRIYILVFLMAFFIDSLRVTYFGLTPLFLVALCTIIFLYEKYSGSSDTLISSIFIAVTSILYAHVLSYSVNLTILLLCIAGIGWFVISQIQRKGIITL
jgi:hypothetical protein